MHVYTIVALLLLCCATAAAQDRAALIGDATPNPADQRYKGLDDAIAAFAAGDIAEAERQLRSLAQTNPELAPAEVMLAQMYFGAGAIASARELLEKAALRHPGEAAVYVIFGELAAMDNRSAEATLVLARAVKLAAAMQGNDFRRDRLLSNAHAALAGVAISRKQWAEAERHATAHLALEPKSSRGLTALARSQFQQGKLREAYATFQKLHEADRASLRPEINMGLMYQQLVDEGDTAKQASAKRAMQQAVAADAKGLITRLVVARWALETCDLPFAIENARAAVEIDSGSADALALLGTVARHQGDAAAAESALKAAIARNPLDSDSPRQLALVYLGSKDTYSSALTYAQLAVRLESDPRTSSARNAAVTLAWVLHALGKRGESLTILQSAVSDSLNAEAAFHAATILAEAKNERAAITLLRASTKGATCFPGKEQRRELLKNLESAN